MVCAENCDGHLIVVAGIGLAVAAFVVFVLESYWAAKIKPVAEAAQLAQQAGEAAKAAANPNVPGPGIAPIVRPTLAEFTALLKGMADLVGSLAKAGPALTSIIASLLFLLIAAIGAGVFQGEPKADKPAMVKPAGEAAGKPPQKQSGSGGAAKPDNSSTQPVKTP